MTFITDHSSLKFLVNQADLSGRLARWMLLLQEFDFTVEVRPGKEHINADYLSRLQHDQMGENLSDNFVDEHLFHVEGIESLYFDIL